MTFTDNAGEKAGAYIGTYTDHIKADSNIVSDYTWVKIEGKDGVSPTITVTKENGVVTIVTKINHILTPKKSLTVLMVLQEQTEQTDRLRIFI